jgi:hypothetical protein
MTSLESLTEFFGWCTVINFAFLIVTSLFLMVCGTWAARIHAKMFGADEAEIRVAYFQYLSNFKVATIVLSLVPYLALVAMA